jgi:hypothetical protein
MHKIARTALFAFAALLPPSSQAVISSELYLGTIDVGRYTSSYDQRFFCTAKVQDDASGAVESNVIVQNTDAANRIQVSRIVWYGRSGAVVKDLVKDLPSVPPKDLPKPELFPADFSPVLNPMQSAVLFSERLFGPSTETDRMNVAVYINSPDRKYPVMPYIAVSMVQKDVPTGAAESRSQIECTIYGQYFFWQ